MEFFAAQDRARRATRLLVGLFALALVAIVGVVYLGVALVVTFEAADAALASGLWNQDLFLLTMALVAGFILLTAWWKTLRLAAGGGAAVAEAVGGRLVPRASEALAERRLVNVVDEMAIAAGLPAPPVYVLEEEGAINAFAAGARPRQAIVAVTRGALEQLDRDELQGVVAHEFSHILNGDMALNLRLMGLVHGLLAMSLLGRGLLRAGSRARRGGAPLVVLGLTLLVAGSLGVLWGRLIKAAVSRQREFLADAAAVQFTRNPDGLAGALGKLERAGSRMLHAEAESVSHMLFDSHGRGLDLLATHPPLRERLRRLRHWGASVPVEPARRPAGATAPRAGEPAAGALDEGLLAPLGAGPGALAEAGAFTASVGRLEPAAAGAAHAWLASLTPALQDALRQSFDAQAVVLALLLGERPALAQAERERVVAHLGEALAARVERELPRVRQAGPGGRLPLLELALGALRELSGQERARLTETARELARGDGRTSLAEYLLVRLLQDALQPRAAGRLRASPAEVRHHCRVLLSFLAHCARGEPEAARTAFARGARLAPLPLPEQDLLPLSAMQPGAVDRALDTLACATPAFRRELVRALAELVIHDGKLEPSEREALRAVCGALDCPTPFLAPAGQA